MWMDGKLMSFNIDEDDIDESDRDTVFDDMYIIFILIVQKIHYQFIN